MDAASLRVLSIVECCVMVFSQEQWAFIIKYYFYTESYNKVREQYEKQFPGTNLSRNKAIST